MKTIVLGALALALAPATANAASFMNGGFEQGPANIGAFTTLANGSTAITGWTVTGDSIDLIGTYWQNKEGNRSIDLNGNGPGGIMQTFDTVAGVVYNVKFWLAGNPDTASTKVVSTVASGNMSREFTALTGTAANMNWQEQSYTFTAGAATTTLAFTSSVGSASGPALDAVSVTAVPEPSTWAMMLVGFGAIGGAMRRRSSQRRVAVA